MTTATWAQIPDGAPYFLLLSLSFLLFFLSFFFFLILFVGVPIDFIVFRGQGIQTFALLARHARQHNFFIPTERRGSPGDQKYEGATVLPPKKGYYTRPVATLDFSALYPSIIMANNLCYTTLAHHDQMGVQKPIIIPRTDDEPKKVYFVDKDTQRGLLPLILNELLIARSRVKKEMCEEKDPGLKAILNARQLALKLVANAVYGFTGQLVGKLPSVDISASVTSIGRSMIKATLETVESHFTIANGFEHDAIVIYGVRYVIFLLK